MLELQPKRLPLNQMFSTSQAKKLVLVWAISSLMTETSIRVEQLERIPLIQDLVQFKGHTTVQALLDSGSKVNAMTPAYAAVLELRIRSTIVAA